MAHIRTIKVHDPRNPNNVIQVNDPEITIARPSGHDGGPNFDPKIHVKVRERGDKYTEEEESILRANQVKYDERRAQLRAQENGGRERVDPRDQMIQRLQRELEEIRAQNAASAAREAMKPAAKDEAPRDTTPLPTSKPAQEAKSGAKKQPAAKDDAPEDTALLGLAGAPEAKK